MRLDQARGQAVGAGEVIETATNELLQAIREVRDLARGLHPTILGERGLAAAVESLAERAPLPIRARVTESRLPAELEAAAYFLIAEALTNAARYADAVEVFVEVTADDEELLVTVTDEGAGGADPSRGSGLQGLTDRIAAVGGSLSVESPPGRGTTLRARIPIGPAP